MLLIVQKQLLAGAKYDGDPWDIVSKKTIVQGALPFGTVLTFAATGSEMNSGSVITNWETNEKYGWGSPYTTHNFLSWILYILFCSKKSNGLWNGGYDGPCFRNVFSSKDECSASGPFCESLIS